MSRYCRAESLSIDLLRRSDAVIAIHRNAVECLIAAPQP
jgi:hypothetical protein